MALLNFLYKDETFIASLYAQIFRGRLVQVALGDTATQKKNSGIKAGLKVVSGHSSEDHSFSKSHQEVIDPHDAATLDVLNHLDQFSVQESECARGDIVKMSGELFLFDYKAREVLLDFGFDMNRAIFEKALTPNIPNKKHRHSIIELSRNGCIGEKDEIRFFLKSNSGKWYWGSLYKHNLTAHMSTLMIVNGASGIPISIIAMHVGYNSNLQTADETDTSLGFSRNLQYMSAMTNSILASGIEFTAGLTPLALVMPINASAEDKES